MADTIFVDQQTVIEADWLQDVNDLTYGNSELFVIRGDGSIVAFGNIEATPFDGRVSFRAVSEGVALAWFGLYTSDELSGLRWALTKTNTDESGSDAGSDFELRRYTDTGVFLGNALTITRSDGSIEFEAPIKLASYEKASLPSAGSAGQMIYVTDETGGAVPAFSDGTNWRRTTDRAIVS